MVQAHRDERLVAVLFLDLDNFKGVNDTYGHEAGNTLLKVVADRLRNCVRSGDSVGRYGGDEFTMLLANLHQVKDAVRVVGKVQSALAQPVSIKGAELAVNASIGLSIYPSDGEREDNLLRAADGAMYHAKKQGKNRARFFSAEYNRMLPDHAIDEDQLRCAFDEGQFQMYYQPRWDTRTHRLVALEALLRWKHPKRGMVPASEFLRLIEQNGFIRPLGNWALEQACEQAQRWRRLDLPAPPVNVNLSAYQFRHQDLPGLVGDIIERFEMPAGSLVLDISEATLHNNMTLVAPALHRLKGLDADICISNFGSGCFCWRDLKHLPHHSLQLGHDLIQSIATDPTDAATANAVLTLASTLNRPISAAGVETVQQLAFLQQHQCNKMQGWLFNRPLPASEIAGLLSKQTLAKRPDSMPGNGPDNAQASRQAAVPAGSPAASSCRNQTAI
jgi:diguanylate cyclase (GGDEF)-like protein